MNALAAFSKDVWARAEAVFWGPGQIWCNSKKENQLSESQKQEYKTTVIF